MSYLTLSSQEKHLFYSVDTFTRIRQHYFSKYWGANAWAVPHLKFWGKVSPRSPPLLLLFPSSDLSHLTTYFQSCSSPRSTLIYFYAHSQNWSVKRPNKCPCRWYKEERRHVVCFRLASDAARRRATLHIIIYLPVCIPLIPFPPHPTFLPSYLSFISPLPVFHLPHSPIPFPLF